MYIVYEALNGMIDNKQLCYNRVPLLSGSCVIILWQVDTRVPVQYRALVKNALVVL